MYGQARLLIALLVATVLCAGARAEPRAEAFPRPASLEPQVRFWRGVFADYSTRQVVLHDAVDLDKVYKVLDFRRYADEGMGDAELDRLQRDETDAEMDHLRAILRRLHRFTGDAKDLNDEERRVYDLLRHDDDPDRFMAAIEDLRSQRGLRERFSEGVRISRRYLPEMERIFREEGVPTEITRLPLVESCFNVNAYSKVGAAGVWQFMPATGRLFMRVDHLVDERRDPLYSARAAARYLHEMYDDLGTWPLALTAYNHGAAGVGRAVRQLGTDDIGRVVRAYRGPAFGFASRNFYAEFIAALEVDRHYQTYFGPLEVEPPLHAHEHRVERPIGIEVAARLAGTSRDELATLNPAFSDVVVEGRRPIPAGVRLRVPAEAGESFVARVSDASPAADDDPPLRAAPAKQHDARRPVSMLTYRVQAGQTLSHIAKRYRVSVASLRTTNRLGKSSTVRAGQLLRIPKSAT